MMKRSQLSYELFVLFLIVIGAAATRFFHLGELSYHNDELSILIRAQYDSFSDFMQYGAISVHPYYFQILVWGWTQMVGFDPWIVRLPFAIMGIFSVALCWAICRRWFGQSAALLSSGLFAFLSFGIYYGQIARPYAPGLFFSLLFIYLLDLWIEQENKPTLKRFLLGLSWVLSASIACGMHYFAALFVGLVMAVSFFKIMPYRRKSYLGFIFLFALSYLPQFAKLGRDLKRGGLYWLGEPDNDWLNDFFKKLFNESEILAAILLFIGIATLFWTKRSFFNFNFRMSMGIFFGIFIIGFFYSIFRSPVLQYSYLLFPLPIFLGALFSGFSISLDNYKAKIAVTATPILILAHTIFIYHYYEKPLHGDYKWIAEQIEIYKAEDQSINGVYHTNRFEYVDFSQDLYGSGAFPLLSYDLNEPNAVSKLEEALDDCDSEYFFFARIKPVFDVSPVIMARYPMVVFRSFEDERYFHVFKKVDKDDYVLSRVESFTEREGNGICNYPVEGEGNCGCTEPGVQFSSGVGIDDYEIKKGDKLLVDAQVWNISGDKHIKLAVQIKQNGNQIDWLEVPIVWYHRGNGGWVHLMHEFEMGDYPKDARVEVFLYSPEGKTCYWDDVILAIDKDAG